MVRFGCSRSFLAGHSWMVDLLWRTLFRISCLDLPLIRTRRDLLWRMAGKVRVRRFVMANSVVVVWATERVSVRAGELGKREAVWPSGPMPRMVRRWEPGGAKYVLRIFSYWLRLSSMGRLVSKKWKFLGWRVSRIMLRLESLWPAGMYLSSTWKNSICDRSMSVLWERDL